MVKDREAWPSAVHGVAKRWTQLSGWTTATMTLRFVLIHCLGYRVNAQKLLAISMILYRKIKQQQSQNTELYKKNLLCVLILLAQSCLTLCNPTDCSLPGSSIHGIFQARILEWVAVSFSMGSSQPRDWTQVSHIAGWFFTVWTTSKAPNFAKRSQIQGILCWMDKGKHKTAKLVWRFKMLKYFSYFLSFLKKIWIVHYTEVVWI